MQCVDTQCQIDKEVNEVNEDDKLWQQQWITVSPFCLLALEP